MDVGDAGREEQPTVLGASFGGIGAEMLAIGVDAGVGPTIDR